MAMLLSMIPSIISTLLPTINGKTSNNKYPRRSHGKKDVKSKVAIKKWLQ